MSILTKSGYINPDHVVRWMPIKKDADGFDMVAILVNGDEVRCTQAAIDHADDDRRPVVPASTGWRVVWYFDDGTYDAADEVIAWAIDGMASMPVTPDGIQEHCDAVLSPSGRAYILMDRSFDSLEACIAALKERKERRAAAVSP